MKFPLEGGWFKRARLRAGSRQIIGLLAVLFTGLLLQACSAMKLAYNQAPDLAYWYLDAYVDFSPSQRPQVKDALDNLHTWHRQTQLPGTIHTLQKLRAQMPGDIDAQQACTVYADVRRQLLAIPAQAEPAVVALVAQLSPAQLAHMERRFSKRDAEFRADFIDATPQKSRAERNKKAVERAEKLYGRLDAAQLAVIHQRVDVSSFNARQTYAERLRRQQDILHTLRPLVAQQAPAAAVQAAVHALWQRTVQSPDPAFRAYREKLEQEACATFAALHNSTTPAQRREAVDTLGRYEQDFRALGSTTAG